jgi:FtsH-binding integral membrane protein
MATTGRDADPTVRDGESRLSAVTVWFGVGLLVVAHVTALVVVTPATGLTALLAVEMALLALVTAVEARTYRSLSNHGIRGPVAALVVAWVGLVGGALLVFHAGSTVVLACALTGIISLVLYGMHRFELVALGLVEVDDERE